MDGNVGNMKIPEKVIKLAQKVKQNGGQTMLVGGCVRDHLMNIVPKDFDCEIYGIESKKLREILESIGKVDTVGSSFQVYKLDNEIDISIPRRERKTGNKHTDFEVVANPHMSYKDTCERRDLTMNAILKDVLTNEIVDPFNGREDIKNKIIRHIKDETFIEDPLRVLRACQFAARFLFTIDGKTWKLCQTIDLTNLSKERIREELFKLLLSNHPKVGLYFLYWLKITKQLFPEIDNLRDIQQDPEWHPEGWSLSKLSLNSFRASMAQTKHIDRITLTFREFFSSSETRLTTNPSSSSTANTEFINSSLTNWKITDTTGINRSLSSPIFSEAVVAESDSFVWSFGTEASTTDKIIRIMFKIPFSSVNSIMKTSIDDLEILKTVIRPISIYMMNMFSFQERSTDVKFHNNSMNPLAPIFTLDTGFNVTSVIVNFRPSSINNYVFFFVEGFVNNIDFIHNDNYISNSFNCQVQTGDVFTHTCQVIDEARKLIDGLPYAEQITVMLAALCHDFGKTTTTEMIDGRWRARGHEEAGIKPTISFLDKLGIHTIDGFDVREQVILIVANHLAPPTFYKAKSSNSAFRRLAYKGVRMDLLNLVSRADVLGRYKDGKPAFTTEAHDWFDEKIKDLKVEKKGPDKFLMGRHLIELGMKPSKEFGQIINKVYEMQLDGKITTQEEAIEIAKSLIM